MLRRTRHRTSQRTKHLALPLVLALGLTGRSMAQPAFTSGDPSTAIDRLVQEATRKVVDRNSQPLGIVVERHRSKVMVELKGARPRRGERLLAMRPVETQDAVREQMIAKLQVQDFDGVHLECREVDRVGKEHVEAGDIARRQAEKTQLLLAPCLSQVDLDPVIVDVLSEKLDASLNRQVNLEMVNNLDYQTAAEAAYWSGSIEAFLGTLGKVDEVLFPILVRSDNRLLMNLQYYSKRKGKATDIDVAQIELDEMLLAWLRSGPARQLAPPGFRALPAQTFAWRAQRLLAAEDGDLIVTTRDSLRRLEFSYPGMQVVQTWALPAREKVRRYSYQVLVTTDRMAGIYSTLAADSESPGPVRQSLDKHLERIPNQSLLFFMSDERAPVALPLQADADATQLDRVAVNELLEALWLAMRGPTQLATRWWPQMLEATPVIRPTFADIDNDGRLDIIWSDWDGRLLLQSSSSGRTEAFSGYGDAKTVQFARDADSNSVLWLTAPVAERRDRLHAAQVNFRKLRVVWSSKAFEGVIQDLVSCDINKDGEWDLVVLENIDEGTRLHPYLALQGEWTEPRGRPWDRSAQGEE